MEGLEKADIFLLENLSEFKGEVANCSKFAQILSSGVDIFVNDSSSQSHKILASTVGVTRFCHSCVAGFYFEESLCQLKKVAETSRNPYVAVVCLYCCCLQVFFFFCLTLKIFCIILEALDVFYINSCIRLGIYAMQIGGGNFCDKAAALHFLASICDGLVFVGKMSFQIMHALGVSVPLNFVEHGALKEALDIVQFAHNRDIQILYPKDFWCKNDCLPGKLKLFPAHSILDGEIAFNSAWNIKLCIYFLLIGLFMNE